MSNEIGRCTAERERAERDGIGWYGTGRDQTVGTVWIKARGDGAKLDERKRRDRKVWEWKGLGNKTQHLAGQDVSGKLGTGRDGGEHWRRQIGMGTRQAGSWWD